MTGREGDREGGREGGKVRYTQEVSNKYLVTSLTLYQTMTANYSPSIR